MSAKSEVVKRALHETEKLENYFVESAKNQLMEAIAPQLKNSALNFLYEAVSVGKDQPSGYDQEADQDALAFGSSKHSTAKKDDINKGGKGPQKLESSIGMDETEDYTELDETEDDLDSISLDEDEIDLDLSDFGGDETEADVSVEDEPELDESEDEELDETKSEDEDLDETKKKDEKDMDESKSEINTLKKENRILRKTNQEYKKAFKIMENKFSAVNLLNAKMSGAIKFLNIPGLSAKQKEKIVEAFDNATSTREVKLITNTLKESLKVSSQRNQMQIARTAAPVASKRLNEGYDESVVREMQRLANIK